MASPTSSPSSSPTATESCITMTPDSNGYVPVTACNAQWSYSPSFPAAIALALFFGLLTLSHLIFAIIFRKRFCWVIVMASAWETSAFVLRSIASHHQQSTSLAIASQLFFLLAPLWVNAFVYMTAGRLIYMLHPEQKIWGFKAMSLGKWFVWLDVFSFIVQGAGGTMLNPGNDASVMDAGKKIYMSGVGVQEAFILLFLGLIVKFHGDALRLEKGGRLVGTELSRRKGMWKWVTYSLYVVLLLITMRIIFRLVEFSGGMEPEHNRLPFEEGYALGLDAVPMVLAILVLAVVHPGLVLKGGRSEFPSRKVRKAEKKAIKAEKKEIKAEKKEAKRMRKEGKTDVEMNVVYTGTQGSGEELINGGRHV